MDGRTAPDRLRADRRMSPPVSGQQTSGVKKSTFKKHTLLIVLCHADDFISIAPMIPKYAAEGHAVHYLALAGRYGLVPTGGSDYHGEGTRRAEFFGVMHLPPEHLDALMALAAPSSRAVVPPSHPAATV